MSPQISISIDVPDMKKAIDFYSKALSCVIVREGEKISQLSADNAKIYLLKKAPGSNPLIKGTSSREYERHWTPVHLDFIIPNIDQVLSLVLEFGGSHEGTDSGDWGAIAYCADPFGNGFCLIKT